MNKRELIERINNTLFDNLKDTLFTEPTLSITENTKDNKVAITFETEQGGALVSGMLKKFEKVTIPQFVADWIERERKSGGDLEDLFNNIVYEQDHIEWFREEENMNLVARAWLDGYEVEKEKRYRVSLKNGQPLLKAFLGEALYFSQDIAIERYEVTRKQLEEAGFGWVFNCPGIEIEEVE